MLITYSFLYKIDPKQKNDKDNFSFYLSITILHGFYVVKGCTRPRNNTKTKTQIKTTIIECIENVSKYFLFSNIDLVRPYNGIYIHLIVRNLPNYPQDQPYTFLHHFCIISNFLNVAFYNFLCNFYIFDKMAS